MSGGYGGAIYAGSKGSLYVGFSTFLNNFAEQGLENGQAVCAACTTTITNSVVQDNGGGDGGGPAISAGPDLTLDKCTIENNNGAGVYDEVSFVIENCLIQGNTGGDGGVFVSGEGEISNSVITQNSSTDSGGGIDIDTGGEGPTPNIVIEDSTISYNTAANHGGGIDGGGDLAVVNSTITGNVAREGGGVYGAGYCVLTDSTISGNTVTGGTGGGFSFNAHYNYVTHTTSPPPTINGTIVSGNTGGDFYGTQYTAGDDIFNGTNNLIGGNALLAGLGTYGTSITAGSSVGGSTPQYVETMALLPGSPALDAGGVFDDESGNPITTDVRGVSRDPAEGSSDIGAFQSQGFNVTITEGNGQSAAVNTPFSSALAVQVTSNDPNFTNLTGGIVTFSAPSSGAGAVLGTNQIIDAATINNASGDVSVPAEADDTPDAPGNYNVTASATPMATSSYTNFTLTNMGSLPVGLPTVSISGASSVNVGASYTLTLNTSSTSSLTWTINWGDGSPDTVYPYPYGENTPTQTHTYTFTSTSNFIITATATDGTNMYAAGTQAVQVTQPRAGGWPSQPPTPTGLQIIQAIPGEIDISWIGSSDPNVVGYNVYVSPEANFPLSPGNLIASDVTTAGYTDNFNSAPDVTWYYEVTAVTKSAQESAPSACVGAMMPTNLPADYQEPGVDGSEPADAGDIGDSESTVGPDTGTEKDLLAFYGLNFGNGNPAVTPTVGNAYLDEIVDYGNFGINGYGLRDYGYNLVGSRIFADYEWQQAEMAVISILDPTDTKVITPTQIAAHQIYVLAYSWGAITAANVTEDLAKPDSDLFGVRIPGPVRGQFVVNNGWDLEAPVQIQVFDAIDPVTSAFLVSGLIRFTGPLDSNVINFNDYYQQSGITSNFDVEDPFGTSLGTGQIGRFFPDDMIGGNTLACAVDHSGPRERKHEPRIFDSGPLRSIRPIVYPVL